MFKGRTLLWLLKSNPDEDEEGTSPVHVFLVSDSPSAPSHACPLTQDRAKNVKCEPGERYRDRGGYDSEAFS